jgi:hypothetical protein
MKTLAISSVFLVLLIVVVVGGVLTCSRKTPGAGGAPLVMSRFGTYNVRDLVVKVADVGGRVDFTVQRNGNELAHSDISASANSRWILYVDTNDWIWLYSGDIGTYVWRPGPSGGYERVAVKENPEAASKVPPEFSAAISRR